MSKKHAHTGTSSSKWGMVCTRKILLHGRDSIGSVPFEWTIGIFLQSRNQGTIAAISN